MSIWYACYDCDFNTSDPRKLNTVTGYYNGSENVCPECGGGVVNFETNAATLEEDIKKAKEGLL